MFFSIIFCSLIFILKDTKKCFVLCTGKKKSFKAFSDFWFSGLFCLVGFFW